MRVFVTGSTGFLGSYLVADLVAHGHEVIALLRPQADTWRLRQVMPRIQVVEGSLDDIEALRPMLLAAKPQALAHLGWRGVGNADRNSPLQARNVQDTVELAALAADIGIENFIGAGSQAEYGPYNRVIAETDEPRPTTLYGMAKLAAGSMVGHLCAARDVRFAWLRIFSTYGPKDADYWLIPSFIRSLRKGERMALTRCEQHWGFLHASDAAAAFRIALTHPECEGIYNVGSPDAPPLRQTIMQLRDLVNPNAELGFGEVPYRPDQVMHLQADIGRLAALGWKPNVNLAEGLKETVSSYDARERH